MAEVGGAFKGKLGVGECERRKQGEMRLWGLPAGNKCCIKGDTGESKVISASPCMLPTMQLGQTLLDGKVVFWNEVGEAFLVGKLLQVKGSPESSLVTSCRHSATS